MNGQLIHYALFGLTVGSQLDLGDLPRAPFGSAVDVKVLHGRTPASLEDATAQGEGYEARPGAALIDLQGLRFLVSDGERIVVEGDVHNIAMVRWRLLGQAFGALLHQRGTLVQHSTVVAMGRRGIGLLGHTGAGKSTFGAFLARRGHPVLLDDTCAIDLSDGRAMARTCGTGVRLHADTLAALGAKADARPFGSGGKFESPSATVDGPIALGAFVALEAGEQLSIRRLDPVQSLKLYLEHTFCSAYLTGLGRRELNLVQCRDLAQAVPAFLLTRPLAYAAMDEAIAVMERTMAGLAA